jgi:uncharacterized protein (DUF488 family)
MPEDSAPKIWTIGHSTHKIETFLELLKSQAIECLADVRRFPGSRRHPQFGQDKLSESLAEAGIQYVHFPALGGRRSGRLPDSPNGAWRVEAFNCYADYMLTSEFEGALKELMTLAAAKRTAIMCAEALPSRCHRRLISDVLAARGWAVQHILSVRRLDPHRLPDFARQESGNVTYPGDPLFQS